VYLLNLFASGERGTREQRQNDTSTEQKRASIPADIPGGHPMEFAEHQNGAMRIDGNSSWISADGRITETTPETFEKFLQDALIFKRQTIAINSRGGSVSGAIKFGKIIREHQFLTTVAQTVPSGRSIMDGHISLSSLALGECANACVFALAGGVERFIEDRSLVGFRSGIVSLEDLEWSFAYMTDMGIGPSIVVKMAANGPTDVKWLSDAELKSTKITYDPKVFGDWTVEPYQAGLAASTKSADGARKLSLFCSATRMKFTLTASGGAYATDFVSSAGDVTEIEVAGKWIAKSGFKISDINGGMQVGGDWTGTDAKREDWATFVLGLGVNGTTRDLYSMYGFNERGFDQSLTLARKNCVS